MKPNQENRTTINISNRAYATLFSKNFFDYRTGKFSTRISHLILLRLKINELENNWFLLAKPNANIGWLELSTQI
jgi:hypothetical protein